MAWAGPVASYHAVTGLRLHLDLQKIQQLELEFISRLSQGHCWRLPGPAVLGTASGRMPIGQDDCRLPVHTLLTRVTSSSE
jgi:hypothetical protein